MLKKIAIYIINFFFCLSILALVILLVFSSTILNKKFILSSLEKNNYYEKTYEDIQDGFKNYIMQSGLEEDILEDLYDMDKIHKDIDNVIEAIYENKEINIDTEGVEEKLDDRINDVLRQNDKNLSNEEKKAIQTFKDNIVDTYKVRITYSKQIVEQIAKMYAKIYPLINMAKIMFIVLSLGLAVIIMVINRDMRENIKTFGIAFVTVRNYKYLHKSIAKL